VLPQARRFSEMAMPGEALPAPQPVAGVVRVPSLHPDDQPRADDNSSATVPTPDEPAA